MRAPTEDELRSVRAWLSAVDERARAQPPRNDLHVYVVVTPLGMRWRCWLEEQLALRDIAIQGRVELDRWPRVSTALQVKRRDLDGLRRAVLFERVWSTHFPDGRAEAWAIDARKHPVVAAAKPLLRSGLECLPVLPDLDRPATLHPFHLADLQDGEHEARRLEAAIELLT